MQVYSVFDHSQRLLRRWDWYPLLAGVHKVAEQDGSFGASGIGTHCADAEFMRDWYPRQVNRKMQWDRFPLTANARCIVSGIGTDTALFAGTVPSRISLLSCRNVIEAALPCVGGSEP